MSRYLETLRQQTTGSQRRRSQMSSNVMKLLTAAAAAKAAGATQTGVPLGASAKPDLPVGARIVSGTADAGGLNPALQAAINRMMKEAPGSIRINSGYRSPKRQAELYAAAIKKYGSEKAARKWVAPPGKSNHGRGVAVDLGFGNAQIRSWVHANAARYGLHFPMKHEPWHAELIRRP